MPATNPVAIATRMVPTAAESSAVPRAKRIRLSRALAARPAGNAAGLPTSATKPKSDPAKPTKLKPASNRYKFPDSDYAQLTALKQRLLMLGVSFRKSELLRAGLKLLVALDDAQLTQAVAKVEVVRTGRWPKKAD